MPEIYARKLHEVYHNSHLYNILRAGLLGAYHTCFRRKTNTTEWWLEAGCKILFDLDEPQKMTCFLSPVHQMSWPQWNRVHCFTRFCTESFFCARCGTSPSWGFGTRSAHINFSFREGREWAEESGTGIPWCRRHSAPPLEAPPPQNKTDRVDKWPG